MQSYMAADRHVLACQNGKSARLVVEAKVGMSAPAQIAEALAAAVSLFYRIPAEIRAQIGAIGRPSYKAHIDPDILVDELMLHLRSVSKTVEEAV